MQFEKKQVVALLGFAAIVWAGALVVEGTPVTPAMFRPFSIVVSAVALAVLVFEKWLWRLPLLHGWFVKSPYIGGTWKVLINSSFQDDSIEGFLAIRQTLTSMTLQLMTLESDSCSIASEVRKASCGVGYEVAFVYRNRPDIRLRAEASPIHSGAAVLTTHGDSESRPASMKGEYWTDRATVGTLHVSDRHDRFYSRVEDAQRAFGAG